MAITCLGSVRRHSQTEVEFQIHDDGSLTERDIERLEENLHPCRIIRRSEADERLNGVFRNYPAARELRQIYPLALKLLDAPLLAREEVLRFCDSDILFFRPFSGLCDGLSYPKTNAVFMEDRKNSYSLRSWHKAFSTGLSLPWRINSGLLAFKLIAYDLDYLNWFIGCEGHRKIFHVLEQTCWAALGKRVGCRKYDPRQVRVMRDGESYDGLVAGHFTARTRGLLADFVERSRRVSVSAESAKLRTVPPGNCTAIDLLRYEIDRLRARFRERNLNV